MNLPKIDMPLTSAELRARVLAVGGAAPFDSERFHRENEQRQRDILAVTEQSRALLTGKPLAVGDLVFYGGGYEPHVARPAG